MKISTSSKIENVKKDFKLEPELKHIFKVSNMIDPKEIGELKATIDDLEVRREKLQENLEAKHNTG